MRLPSLLLLAVLAGAACAPRVATRPAAEPLRDEAELLVYLQPSPSGGERVAVQLGAIAVVDRDGRSLPLELVHPELTPAATRQQLLVAAGRLPPGTYSGLDVRLSRATLETPERPADLLVPSDPVRVSAPIALAAGQAAVLWLTFDAGKALGAGQVELRPAFEAQVPARPLPELSGYATVPRANQVVVFDTHRRQVGASIATSRGPRGLALDRSRARGIVAATEDDELQIFDLANNAWIGRVRLGPGDRPLQLAIVPESGLVVSINAGSATASFVDPAALVEVARVPICEDAVRLVPDRTGPRAFVLCGRSAAIQVLDLAGRMVQGTVALEAEPVDVALDRSGERLYVVQRNVPYLALVAMQTLALTGRTFVGLGVASVHVDATTDLVYLGRLGERRIQIYEPRSLAPAGAIDVPGTVTSMAIDGDERLLFAVIPDSAQVAVVDLVGRRLVGRIELGDGPYDVALARERE